jgi:hypothetical protein
MAPNLSKEQQATLQRPLYPYSLAARFFFWSMDLMTGKKTTLPKVKLIEILASVPYHSWELRQQKLQTQPELDQTVVSESQEILVWARAAKDNEDWHLLVVNEKIKEDGIKEPWFLSAPFPQLMVGFYSLMTRVMAWSGIHKAFLFNAEFEDHAEHEYALFVEDHPEWEQQSVDNEQINRHGELPTWAEVFKRIGLDERDHMNASFIFCDKEELVVKYDGMPQSPNRVAW